MANQLSLFADLKRDLGDDARIFTATKPTLVHLSHIMEDIVLERRIPAILFTGFQESSHWLKETQRYLELAGVAKQVTIFSGGPLPNGPAQVAQITLQGDDPLRQEWFVLVLSDVFSGMICGLDNLTPAATEAQREFETLWSVNPSAINRALDTIERVLETYRPDLMHTLQAARSEFRPNVADPTIMSELITRMLDFEQTLQRRLMHAEHELRTFNVELEARVKARTEELAAVTRQLEILRQVKDDFITSISHELRTPLTSIKLYLHLIRSNPTKNERYLSIVERETRRLEHLIEDLLYISSKEQNDYRDGESYTIDLNTLARQFIFDRQLAAKGEGITLTFSPAQDLPHVIGDQLLLGRALSAVLSNALAYTPAGEQVTVRTAVTERNGYMYSCIRVKDSGPGIPTDEYELIFERFYRGRVARQSNQPGTGLGLPIARSIVEKHGGQLLLRESSEQGTTFELMLPAVET